MPAETRSTRTQRPPRRPRSGSPLRAVEPGERSLPAAGARPARGSGEREQNGLQGLIAGRIERAAKGALDGPDPRLMSLQSPLVSLISDHYFRLETDGWQRLPDEPCLLVGVHSGGALTMDVWTLVFEWYRRFGEQRILHGTAHDVLMAAPGLGDFFRANGVLPASRRNVGAALAKGHDVIVWPGGEQDAMRSWRKRDTAVLAGRKGFVKQALRSQVPIVPVATIGGHDTVFVLSEGRFLARWTGLGKLLRGATLPITLGFPFGIAPEILPTHVPLPAKIRTELLEPIRVDADPERASDRDYVDGAYREVEAAIQAGMDRLARRRSFPLLG